MTDCDHASFEPDRRPPDLRFFLKKKSARKLHKTKTKCTKKFDRQTKYYVKINVSIGRLIFWIDLASVLKKKSDRSLSFKEHFQATYYRGE